MSGSQILVKNNPSVLLPVPDRFSKGFSTPLELGFSRFDDKLDPVYPERDANQ